MFGDDSDHHRPNQTHPVDLGKTSVFLVSVASALFLFEDLLLSSPLNITKKQVDITPPKFNGWNLKMMVFPKGHLLFQEAKFQVKRVELQVEFLIIFKQKIPQKLKIQNVTGQTWRCAKLKAVEIQEVLNLLNMLVSGIIGFSDNPIIIIIIIIIIIFSASSP